jgi:hypothetical protein
MKKLLIVICIFALFAFSCGLFEDSLHNQTRTFWATNFDDGKDYTLTAELLHEGRFCVVWAERGSGVTATTARSIANVYDTQIYSRLVTAFSETNIVDEWDGTRYDNIIEFATRGLIGGNGKLIILLLDIQDGYKGTGDPFVEGYFWAGNFLEKDSHPSSNESAMVYIDTFPGRPGSPSSNMTLAHELQHLMNYASTIFYDRDSIMDTWIDEGLSAAAEWVFAGQHPQWKIDWYNKNESGLINRGNNFFVWDNHRNNPLAILDDYSTVYLFFQWLRIQSNTNIYRNIITSHHHNHEAVLSSFNSVAGTSIASWDHMLRDWLAANYIDNPTGRFGYMGHITPPLTRHYFPAGTTSASLFPGEGVYSKFAGTSFTQSNTGNVVHASLSSTSVNQTFITTSGNTLLTYNRNTNITASAASGTTTGVAGMVMSSEGRFVSPAPFTGPFPIGARDLLRRNGINDNKFDVDIPSFSRRVVIDE